MLIEWIEFLFNLLQTLSLWSLGIEVSCYDFFFKNSQLFFWIYSRSLCMDRCRFNDVHVGWCLIHCMSRLKCEQSVQAGPVIPANTKRRSNVVLMLGQRRRKWYDIQPTERQINMFTGPSECVSISQTNIYLYKSTKAQWGLLISEI